ncbi:MAG: DUF4388 domain-containing protein [Xenococcaceae cyanobacterium MO_188.B32]|nr:DUF4388 domain-containing protein [Xenococcaceae cyanobacterium MO_188.B32]
MTISGFLESFSFPELLRLIDLGSKSGRLILQVRSAPNNSELLGLYHIWFREGRLVTVINRSNYQSLIAQIESRGWLSQFISQKLKHLCLPEIPLGSYLEEKKLLTEQQLDSLFQTQTAQVYQLFEVPVGCFLFHEISFQSNSDKKRRIPWLEMTGKSIRAIEISLNALRLQQNWDIFADQLPESSYALTKLVGQPYCKLIPLEWQLWELANGQISLKAIAGKINQPLLKVQKAALSLIMAGLVDEMPIVYTPSSTKYTSDRVSRSLMQISSSNTVLTTTKNRQRHQTDRLNISFLKAVVNFLRSKFG